MRSPRARWLFILACGWFAIGVAYFSTRGIPRMLHEWKTYAPVETELAKRDLVFPGWAECVQAIREKVPPGSDLIFLSDADENLYTYFRFLLNYEVYPQRHLDQASYNNGMRPRFILFYGTLPAGMPEPGYVKVYQGRRATLLEKQ